MLKTTPVVKMFLVLLLSQWAVSVQAEEAGVCAEVKIALSQKVAITRTAFQATLQISNSQANIQIQKVQVILDIRDSSGNPADSKFGISNPVLTSISDVAGGGTIAPSAQATAIWTILPTQDAAPTVDTHYTVGGTINYTQNGLKVSLPLFPAPITVKPDPLLQFHYFWQHTVYGDDPFTPEIEPSEPFSLGLLVVNKGAGTAHNLTITSSQPKIVDNEKGLLIAFHLIGAAVNDQSVSPSLTVNIGDVGPAGTATADFLLTSTLQGEFISYSASFKHVDDLNNPRTSILDSVDVHELEHVVRVVDPADDNKPDFLTHDNTINDTPGSDHLPDTLWNSDSTVSSVVPALNGTADGTISNSNLTVHLAVPSVPSGFVYIRLNDPGQNAYQLASVVRSDGKVIPLGEDAWTTHRIIRLEGQTPYAQDRLYLFDDHSTGAYTLTYGPITSMVPIVVLTNPHDGDTFSPKTSVTVAATATSLQAAIKELDFYDGSSLIGSSLAAPFTLPYLPAIGLHTLTAIATDTNGAQGTSAPVSIMVSSTTTTPPIVQITEPTDGADLIAPATVTVSAAASEQRGTIAKVDFYNNGSFLGSTISAPYALPLENIPAGTYTLTAIATDLQNKTAASSPITLQVDPPLTSTGSALLRVVSAIRQTTPGQLMVTVQNGGETNAVSLALMAARTKWGGQVPSSITPVSVPMLAPNSSATFMLQFPASATGPLVLLSGTYSGRNFGGVTRVTP